MTSREKLYYAMGRAFSGQSKKIFLHLWDTVQGDGEEFCLRMIGKHTFGFEELPEPKMTTHKVILTAGV